MSMMFTPCKVGEILHPATGTPTLLLLPADQPHFVGAPATLTLSLPTCRDHRPVVEQDCRDSFDDIIRVVVERGGDRPDPTRIGFRWDGIA